MSGGVSTTAAARLYDIQFHLKQLARDREIPQTCHGWLLDAAQSVGQVQGYLDASRFKHLPAPLSKPGRKPGSSLRRPSAKRIKAKPPGNSDKEICK